MKPLSQLFFGLTSALFLISCNGNQGTKNDKDQIQSNATGSIQPKFTNSAQPLAIDSILFNKYLEGYQNDAIPYEKEFFSKLLTIIKAFNGRKLDTTLLTIGNIADDIARDTISSRVYYKSDSIYIDSKWVKNNHILWHYKYSNPYNSFNSDLFDGETRSVWVIFAVGIVYGIPEIHPRQEGEQVDPMVYDQGVDDLKAAGIKTDKEQYKIYLQNFKGGLVGFGQPEGREGTWIWYKPARRLITYFQP